MYIINYSCIRFPIYTCRYVQFRKVDKIGHDCFAASFRSDDNIIFRYTHYTHNISLQLLGRVIFILCSTPYK